MTLYRADSNSTDNSTEGTESTRLETVPGEHAFLGSSAPCSGSTFIIRRVSSGKVITQLGGRIMLAHQGGEGSILWTCVESGGWLGFQDPISNRFLGHGVNGTICCTSKRHLGFEYFQARPTLKGGYVLVMTHWLFWRRYVVMIEEEGLEKLAKIGDRESDGVVWEFIQT